MKFDALEENIDQEKATIANLFGGDRRVSARAKSPDYDRQVLEAKRFVDSVTSGRRPLYHLREAMSTSDFPSLFADVLDRELLGRYQDTPSIWSNFIRRGRVPDFRAVKRFAIDGAEGPLPLVEELEEYPEAPVHESQDEYAVAKRGRRIDLSWESLINDDLDAFRDLPNRLARGARRSEDRFATELFVDENGPHATLYTSGAGNIITDNPALTVEGLQAGFQALSDMKDADGEPIVIEAVELVVPPALEIPAMNILNAVEVRITQGDNEVVTGNWLRNRVRVSVDPYIPMIAGSANGSTSWFLFAQAGFGRPALEMGFLVGHEEPALYERMPDARRVGGGEATESFYDDSRAWRVRHVFGGARLIETGGQRATVASNGSGS